MSWLNLGPSVQDMANALFSGLQAFAGWLWAGVLSFVHGPTMANMIAWIRRRFSKLNLVIATAILVGMTVYTIICWAIRTILQSVLFVGNEIVNVMSTTGNIDPSSGHVGSGVGNAQVMAFINAWIPVDICFMYIGIAAGFAVTCTILRIVKSLIPTISG